MVGAGGEILMKKNTPKGQKTWTPEELKIMAKYAGKKAIDEIVILVNSVGGNMRDKNSIAKKGCLQGLSFRMIKQ